MENVWIQKKFFKIPYSQISLVKQIGQGGGGIVFQGKYNGVKVAVKKAVIRRLSNASESLDSVTIQNFEKEISLLLSLSHPFIVKCYGCSLERNHVAVVLEFCDEGDLSSYLRSRSNQVSLQQKLQWFRQLASALAHMHSKSVIHRDIKPENCLLTNDLKLKLTDFGISRVVDTHFADNKTSAVGTRYYMAPEMILGGGRYDEQVDIFSFAILVCVVVMESFQFPYGQSNTFGVETQIAHGLRPTYSSDQFSSALGLESLMTTCWDADPTQRLSAVRVVESIDSILESFSSFGSGEIAEGRRRSTFTEPNKARGNAVGRGAIAAGQRRATFDGPRGAGRGRGRERGRGRGMGRGRGRGRGPPPPRRGRGRGVRGRY